jgi:ankyrin repeat protein
MPPTGALTAAEVAIIKKWIDDGARWPDEFAGESTPEPSSPAATSLLHALRIGDEISVTALLASDIGVVNSKGADGATPLMYAALYGSAATVKRLIEAGADPKARDQSGATALMWAVGDEGKTRLLLDRGADVNARSDDGRTPLMIAAGLPGRSAVVRLLLDRGAQVNVAAAGGYGRTTPLAEAAYAGDPETFQLLIDHHADVDAAGPITIGFAALSDCKKCLDTLLKTSKPATLSESLLFVAPPNGPGDVLRLLLDQGADAKITDPQGRTLLMLAAASDTIPVDAAQLLLARGVDVNAVTAAGETALRLARLRGQTAMVDLLLKAGAHDERAAIQPAKPAPAASPRTAVERALPLLQESSETFSRKMGCVSCHNNTLTAMVVATARSRGLAVDEKIARTQRETIGRFAAGWRERLLQGFGLPGDSDSIGYILLGLSAEGYPADEGTDAMALFLMRQQSLNGQWHILAHRPPIESNDIEVTAVALRALQVYAPKTLRASSLAAMDRAAAWLGAAEARTTEERVFQLLGLKWAHAETSRVERAARGLVTMQRGDGGWSQLPTLESDAYATGQALFALVETGMRSANDAVYRRGAAFLLSTQTPQGAWWVQSRAIPVQPYFETGFPFGRDQFVSAAATNWAAMALATGIR